MGLLAAEYGAVATPIDVVETVEMRGYGAPITWTCAQGDPAYMM
jgi:hypothetical protein